MRTTRRAADDRRFRDGAPVTEQLLDGCVEGRRAAISAPPPDEYRADLPSWCAARARRPSMSDRKPLMPKATAVWLVENTSLTFEQIAEFCGLHVLEVKGIADGDVA